MIVIRFIFWIAYRLTCLLIYLCRWDMAKCHAERFNKFIGMGYFTFNSPAFVKDVEIRIGWWEIKRLK